MVVATASPFPVSHVLPVCWSRRQPLQMFFVLFVWTFVSQGLWSRSLQLVAFAIFPLHGHLWQRPDPNFGKPVAMVTEGLIVSVVSPPPPPHCATPAPCP